MSSFARTSNVLERLPLAWREKLERYMSTDFRSTAILIEQISLKTAKEFILPRLWNFPGIAHRDKETIAPTKEHLELARDVILLAAILDSEIYIVSGHIPNDLAAEKRHAKAIIMQHVGGMAVDIWIPNEDPLIVSTIMYQLLLDRHFSIVNNIVCGMGLYHMGVWQSYDAKLATDTDCFAISREIYSRHSVSGPVIFKVER